MKLTERQFKIITIVAAVILTLGIGFLCGRATIKQEKETVTVIKYIKGEKITDSIEKPVPYAVYKPIDTCSVIQECVKNGIYSELFPEKTIVEYIEVTKEDTSAIIQDWGTKRLYHEKLFDSDTLGVAEVDAEVQYNRLNLIGYSFTPTIKEVTTTTTINKTKLFSPFIGAGISCAHWSENKELLLNANAGVFVKEKYGLNLQYNYSWDKKINYIGASLMFKL